MILKLQFKYNYHLTYIFLKKFNKIKYIDNNILIQKILYVED